MLSDEENSPFYRRLLASLVPARRETANGKARRNLIFFSGLLSICAAAAFVGAVPTHQYGHDIFFLLDNGWRAVNCQRPHVDYFSGWGPLTFLIAGLGLTVSNYSVDGIGYGNAIVALCIGVWSYLLSRSRLRPTAQIVLSLSMAVLIVAPFPLGSQVTSSSFAMVYNRYGYALLGLVLLEAFRPTESSTMEAGEWRGGVSSGVAAALALFIKSSYFLVSILLILGISLIQWRMSRRRLMGLLFGFSLAAFAFLAYLNFDIRAVFNDLQMTAKARSESLSFMDFRHKITGNATYYCAVLSLTCATFLSGKGDRSLWRLIQLSLLGSLVFFADTVLLFTNMQIRELPLIAVFAILQMDTLASHFQKSEKARTRIVVPWSIAVVLIGSLIFAPRFLRDVSGLAYGVREKAWPSHLDSLVRFTEPRLRPLLLYDGYNPRSNGSQYVTYINDGVALLRNFSAPEEKVITMDMTNPFPYAMGRMPPMGGIAAVAYGYTLDEENRPSDERYFGTADIVMVPKRPAADDNFYYGFYKIYEAGLHERFRLVVESDWWYLYRRRK